jgi:hypothetical protein
VRLNINFSVAQPKPRTEVFRNYKSEDGKEGFEIDQCLFTDLLFRNKQYFQATHLLRVKNRLSSIIYNFNHDLSETDDQYLGNKTQLINIWSEYNDGVFEIWGTTRSTDPTVVARKDEITAPSVECAVETDNLIQNELGLYSPEIDFYGIGLLTGVIAGSGGTRNGEIRNFNFNLNNINMTEQQLKELLEAQKNAITLDFSQKLDKTVLEFSEKVTNQSQSQTKGVCSWVGSDGKTYTESWESIYKSMIKVKDAESETAISETAMMEFKNKFGLPEDFKFQAEGQETTGDKGEHENSDTETLTNIENNLKQAEKIKNSMKDSKEEETDPQGANPAKQSYSSFINSLTADSVTNN